MWKKLASTLVFAQLFVLAPFASARFLYLTPYAASAEKIAPIFISSPLTSTPTAAEKLPVRTLTVIAQDGKRTELTIKPEDAGKPLAVSGAETVFASVDYGVSNRGEGQAVLLRYHAKFQPVDGKAVGLPVEITPKTVTGGVAFVATAGGKPLGNATVTIHEPGDTDPRTVTTDADGLTPTYSKPGRYAVRVSRFEKAKGEHEGRAYTGIWEYSTLVTEVK